MISRYVDTSMTTRVMTDSNEIPAMAGRFDVHAQTVEDGAPQDGGVLAEHLVPAGVGPLRPPATTHLGGERNTAVCNIVTMLNRVRGGRMRRQQ